MLTLCSMEDEVRSGYLVKAEVKKLWATELEILLEIDRICCKWGIKYWVDYGTMLGAVRHKGFIPWDDDLDLGMLRSDYEKFCRVVTGELPPFYFFQTSETDPEYLVGNACIRKEGTTAIMYSSLAPNGAVLSRFHQGISVDIIIYDNLPDDPEDALGFATKILRIRRDAGYRKGVEALARVLDFEFLRKDFKLFLAVCYRKVRYAFQDFFRKTSAIDILRSTCEFATKYSLEETGVVAPLTTMPYGEKELKIDKKLFDRVKYVQFENIKVPILEKYDERLRICYGDWRTPVRNSSKHGGVFFKIDESYKKFLNKRISF